jgi:prolipoprotein diacylglyceryl transferase
VVWDVSREMIIFGSLPLRWYSLLFAFGIVTGYFLMISMYKAEGKPPGMVDALLIYVVIGTVVGARLGHCLFYEPYEYLHDPIRILKVWEGGLASHGGYAGVIAAMWLYTRRRPEIGFLWLADRIAPTALFAGAMIRIGNLFNSEILGRPTDNAAFAPPST